jgi:hypothetical protein
MESNKQVNLEVTAFDQKWSWDYALAFAVRGVRFRWSGEIEFSIIHNFSHNSRTACPISGHPCDGSYSKIPAPVWWFTRYIMNTFIESSILKDNGHGIFTSSIIGLLLVELWLQYCIFTYILRCLLIVEKSENGSIRECKMSVKAAIWSDNTQLGNPWFPRGLHVTIKPGEEEVIS